MKRFGTVSVALMLICAPLPAHAGGAVVSAGVTDDTTLETLKDAWMEGRLNGHRISVVDMPEGSPERLDFYHVVFGFNDDKQIRIHWTKALFRGNSSAPTVVHDRNAVIAYLREHPNAVAYLEGTTGAMEGLHVLARY